MRDRRSYSQCFLTARSIDISSDPFLRRCGSGRYSRSPHNGTCKLTSLASSSSKKSCSLVTYACLFFVSSAVIVYNLSRIKQSTYVDILSKLFDVSLGCPNLERSQTLRTRIACTFTEESDRQRTFFKKDSHTDKGAAIRINTVQFLLELRSNNTKISLLIISTLHFLYFKVSASDTAPENHNVVFIMLCYALVI